MKKEQPEVHALGFSTWKRPILRRFLPEYRVSFVRSSANLPRGATLAIWAGNSGVDTLIERSDVNRLVIEDGFLRSVGLGADLTAPLSWLVDSRCAHFDCAKASDLEVILQSSIFDEAIMERAHTLRARLVQAQLSKYNVGDPNWEGLSPGARGKEVVLVVGQVESDASLRHGSPVVKSNMELLRRARSLHPDAWIVYKPHPDVVAGLRSRSEAEAGSTRWCSEVIENAPIGALLDRVDTVHVMSSLAGFEAVLRGKRTVCHGIPFFAGWGLTEDLLPCARRTRWLSIDEIVAGALIIYPRYVSGTTGLRCSVEDVVDELALKKEKNKPISALRAAIRPFLRRQ